MLLTYLSGTILFEGLKKVEQVGVDLQESDSDTVKDNEEHKLGGHRKQKTKHHFHF